MNDRALIWAIFFFCATIREKKEAASIETDAQRADLMMKEFETRFPPTAH